MIIAAILAAAAVSNLDFESGLSNWRVSSRRPGTDVSVVSGDGRRGSSALVWASTNAANHCYAVCPVEVEGGRRYRFGARVKIDSVEWNGCRNGIRPVRVELCWSDGRQKLLGQYNPPVLASNEADQDGWYKLEGISPALGGTTASGKIVLYMALGSTGRVRFDDVLFEPLSEEPVGDLFTSAYRDEAWEGAVSFHVGLTVNEVRHPLSGLRAEFSYRASDGSRRTVRADSFDGEGATVRLAVADFATGTAPVAFRLMEGTNRLGVVSRAFTRLKGPPSRKVRVDGFGRLLVEGKPFFPIGMYYEPGSHHDEMFRTYCQGPYNCIIPYCGNSFPDRKLLDECAAAGLKVIADLKGGVSGDRWPREDCKTPERARATVGAYADSVKGHPALLGYQTIDETPLAKKDRVRELYDVLAERDPDHPVIAVLDNPSHARDHRNAYDVISVDPYPIGNSGNRSDIAKCGAWSDEAERVTKGSCALWLVPQAFRWSRRGGEYPTEDEFRNMVWQGIVAGANAVLAFSYATYTQLKDPDVVRGYERVLSGVRIRTPILLSEPGAKLVRAPAGADARRWKTSSGEVTAYVNRTRQPVSGEFVFDDGSRTTRALKPLEVVLPD